MSMKRTRHGCRVCAVCLCLIFNIDSPFAAEWVKLFFISICCWNIMPHARSAQIEKNKSNSSSISRRINSDRSRESKPVACYQDQLWSYSAELMFNALHHSNLCFVFSFNFSFLKMKISSNEINTKFRLLRWFIYETKWGESHTFQIM